MKKMFFIMTALFIFSCSKNAVNNGVRLPIVFEENYCEIKDKFIKHNFLLTEIEQMCFGKNKRLGTHFHKDNNGNIYNYYGNRRN